MDEWSEVIDKGNSVDFKYLDVRKAFDTEPHNRLTTVQDEENGTKSKKQGRIKRSLRQREQRVASEAQTSTGNWFSVAFRKGEI